MQINSIMPQPYSLLAVNSQQGPQPSPDTSLNFKANVKFAFDKKQPMDVLSGSERYIIRELFRLIGFDNVTCFITPFGEQHRNIWTQRGINVHFFSHKGSKMHNVGAFYYSQGSEEAAIDKGAIRAATKAKEELEKVFGPDCKANKTNKQHHYRRPLLPVRQITEQEARKKR